MSRARRADAHGPGPREHDAGLEQRALARPQQLLLPLEQPGALVLLEHAEDAVPQVGRDPGQLADRALQLLPHQRGSRLVDVVRGREVSGGADRPVVLVVGLDSARLFLLERLQPPLHDGRLLTHGDAEEEVQRGEVLGGPSSAEGPRRQSHPRECLQGTVQCLGL